MSRALHHRHSHQVNHHDLQQTHRCRRAVQISAAVAEVPAAEKSPSQADYEFSQETLSGSRKRITVTAPPKLCQKAWNKMIKVARKEVKAPGFRDMKSVSESVLMPYLGGQLGAKAAAVEELIKFLPEEIKELTADAISDSVRPDNLTDEMVMAFDVTKPFTYQIVYDVEPILKWKQPYKGMKVEVRATGDDSTARAKVEQELLRVRKKKGGLTVVQGRGLQIGDSAVVDFDAKRSDTGQEFQGSKRRKTTLDTDSADMQFLPGVSEAMVGMKVGETRDIQLVLPDDFEPAGLRGVDVTCTVRVTELFQYELAELNDDLAEEVAPGSGGAEGLQAQLFRMQQDKTTQDNIEAVDEAIMEAVVDLVQCEVPHSMVADMGKQEYQSRLLNAQARGEIDYEKVMQLATQESVDNFTQKHQQELSQLIRRQMGFEHIFKAEKLIVTDAELQEEYNNAVHEFEQQKQEFDEGKLREQVAEALKGPKIMDWLRSNAEITMLPSQA